MTGTVGAPPIEPLDLDTGAGLLARSTAWVRAHPGLVVMLIAPFVLFAAPTVAGKAFLDGDNFLQNFPLRALVGRDLAHGTLPLWNPYLYSGTPLLGGFNAGAVYPTTWLMAVLPLPAAWAVNLAVAYDVALLGTYLFLRRLSIGSTAATFGATTFAFAGYIERAGRPHRPDPGRRVAPLDAVGRPSADRCGPGQRRAGVGDGRTARLGRAARLRIGVARAERRGRGDPRRRLARRRLLGGPLRPVGAAPRHAPAGAAPLGPPGGRRPRRRPPARRRPVAAGDRLPAGLAAVGRQLRLLLDRVASVAIGHPGRLAVRPRHQPGPAVVLHRAVQLPRGDQLRGHPGPHRRLHPPPPAVAKAARGPLVARLVRGARDRSGLRPRCGDPLRPPPLPHPLCEGRAPSQPKPPSGRLLAGGAPRLVGAPAACRARRARRKNPCPASGTLAPRRARGDRGDLRPPRRRRAPLRRSVGRRVLRRTRTRRANSSHRRRPDWRSQA